MKIDRTRDDRIAGHEDALATINAFTVFDTPDPTVAEIGHRLVAMAAFEPDRKWEEFSARAAATLERALYALKAMHKGATEREAEAAELARLRAEEIARQQKERDEKIAAEAAEKRQASAIEAERKRVADEAARFAAETSEREANTKHRAKINNEIVAALAKLGFEGSAGKMIVEAIFRGNIPHVKIVY